VIAGRDAVLLDTSGWLAAVDPRQQHHDKAREAYRSLLGDRVHLLTTNLLVAEMHMLISKARGPEAGLAFLDALYADPTHEIVHVDRDLELDAVDRWMRKHPETRLSVADVTAFELAHRRKVKRVLALDAHFRIPRLTLLPG